MSVQDKASLDEALAVPLEKSSLAALNTRLFLQNPGAVGGLAFMLLITLSVIFAPWIMPFEPQEIDLLAIRKPPSTVHLLGTDLTGRDMLTRILYGGRVSLLIGLLAVIIRTTIGLLLGAVSGYFGGAVDFVIQRVVDIMMVFPTIFLLLILVAAFGPTPLTLLVALGLLSWPFDARIFRGQIPLHPRVGLHSGRPLYRYKKLGDHPPAHRAQCNAPGFGQYDAGHR